MPVAEIFLAAFIQVLFEKLASVDLLNFASKERFDTLLVRWRMMVEQVGAVLADAEEKQITNRDVNLCLEDLEDLAYDMDDVLDELATEALSTGKVRALMPNCCTSFNPSTEALSTGKVRALMPNFCTSFNPSTIVSDFRMRSKIDEITERLRDLLERCTVLGIRTIAAGGSGKASQRPLTSSLIYEPCLYGRDDDKNAIIELLLNDQPSSTKVGVVPIVGMGGVGKTTLAQMVYNDEMIDKHFEMKAWVCVSDDFDIIEVTKAILESITSMPCDFQALDQVQIELKKALEGKKFLIVLDDVWNQNRSDWSSLISPFNDGALGSKLIVTTQNKNVALIMAGTNNCHYLKELSTDDCWSVFAQRAFQNRSMDENPNLVSIGRKIVKKCGGLPLAARTLGSLLRYKLTECEWGDVLNSKIIWVLLEGDGRILPNLRSSYYRLPSHLKKCFAYCSILPKDYEFEEKELVLLWMAQGLIPEQTGQKQIEDLGHEYFHELLSRSFFQPSSSGKLFVMHDLINDLAQFVAGKIYFRLEDESEGYKNISKARHSSYTRGPHDGVQKFEAFHTAKNLRTFLPCGSRYEGHSYFISNDTLDLLLGLRRLRVLSLRRYRIYEIPSSIGDLKHLRYLDLTCALIFTLPESIGTLYNLQTLILRDCKHLTKLPINTSNLINLRHLDVTGADSLREMPPRIGKLTSLQTLSNYIIGNDNGSAMKELGNLIHLRGTLCISGLENVADDPDALRANLMDKEGLDVLLMKWSNISHNSHNTSLQTLSIVLDMLRPHKNLKELSIDGYGGLTFPSWVGNSFFSNMVCLKFQNCEKCTSLPPLGQLPSLAKLYIQGMKAVDNVGLEFYGLGCLNPFPALEILSFEDMPEWIEWTPFGVEEGGQPFARLSELSIKRCPKLLHELPRNLPWLKKLDIERCPVLVVAWGPRPTELNEMRNTLHFDLLVSLHLNDISIPDSFYSPEVGDEAVRENSRHSLLSSLTSLKLKNIRGHRCLPSWFFHGLTGLQELNLSDCEDLTTLWENEVSLQHRLPALQSLTIEFCNVLQSLPDLTLLNNLEKLEVYFCLSLTYLSSRSGLPPALNLLSVVHCPKLISLIAEGDMKINCPSLEYIHIISCERLKTLPDVTQNIGLRNLRQLEIHYCDNLESLPKGWFPAPNLRRLDIRGCEKLDPLPNHAYKNNNLASLEQLVLDSSPAATGLVSHILDEGSSSYFTNLTSLVITIDRLCGFCRFCTLRELTLSNFDWVSFPEDGMLSLPSSLIFLYIWNFPILEKLSCKNFENLASLEHLGISHCPKLTSISELGLLHSLSSLSIFACPNLASFPEQGMPPSLFSLSIRVCPKLEQRFEKGKGQYWRFIAHMPQVLIDDRSVFDRSS